MLDVAIARRLATIDLEMAISLDAEVLALFGPSGSGKSMTLKMIAGIETPDRGTIRSGERLLFDTSTGTNLPPQRRRIGYVPQHYALFPHLTALENITFPLRKGLGWSTTRANERGRELLETFGLSAQADTRPRQLSGGQQQRVALARALAGEPEILLLDEPFAALDTPTREELRQEFRSVQQRLDIPVLFVTHDLEEAATLAPRMAVIVDGKVQQLDATRSILDRPANRSVAELVRARNILPATVQHAEGGNVLDTPVGRLQAGAAGFPTGSTVDVIIRPEVIRVVQDTVADDEIALSGTITDIVDRGTRVTVILDVAGSPLEVDLAPVAARSLSSGEGVQVAIPVGDVHVVAG